MTKAAITQIGTVTMTGSFDDDNWVFHFDGWAFDHSLVPDTPGMRINVGGLWEIGGYDPEELYWIGKVNEWKLEDEK